MRLLIAYSTVDGHTLEICERIADIARAAAHSPEVVEIGSVPASAMAPTVPQ